MVENLIKNKTNIYIGCIVLITSVIISIISILMYFNLSKPEFYTTFIEMGYKFLNESKYEEAILEFKKAIRIEAKSTDARVGTGKAYICINKIDNAVEEFNKAQSLDIENTNLLLEILEILNDIDAESAYEILQNYIDKTQNTIPDNIKEIIKNSNDKPKANLVSPNQGTYINPINIKLNSNKLVVGNTFYYTLDGSEPSKESIKYSGSIDIKEDSIIKIIAYNHKGESSEIVTLEYFIDNEMMKKLEELIKESEILIESTKEGTNIGNCIKGSKKKFKDVINSVKDSLDKDSITYEVANEMYEKISNALDEFKYNIIEKTDKSVLKDTISKAQKLYDKGVEGSREGQYRVGSKSKLLTAIKESQVVYDDILSKQKDIDNSVYLLNQAINTFNNNKIVAFNKDIALKYAINVYGKPFEHVVEPGQEIGPDCIIDTNEYIIHVQKYYFDSDMYIKNGLRCYDISVGYAPCSRAGGGGMDVIYLRVYENGKIEEVGGDAL